MIILRDEYESERELLGQRLLFIAKSLTTHAQNALDLADFLQGAPHPKGPLECRSRARETQELLSDAARWSQAAAKILRSMP
jgi:hypothetical protein